MKITKVSTPPTQVSIYDNWDGPGHEDIEDKLSAQHVEDVVEIFQTPLTGHYNWDYSSADGRIRKLYKLGKELNWNADMDVDWSESNLSQIRSATGSIVQSVSRLGNLRSIKRG